MSDFELGEFEAVRLAFPGSIHTGVLNAYIFFIFAHSVLLFFDIRLPLSLREFHFPKNSIIARNL